MIERNRADDLERTRRIDEVEFANNPEQRCPCVVVVDVSGSMHGPRIEAVNQGIAEFYRTIAADDIASQRVELCLLAFHDEVETMQEFTTIDGSMQPPHLQAGGGTEMCQAIDQAMGLLEQRKQTYKDNGVPYYRPWIVFMTDGAPNDRHLIPTTAETVQRAFQQRQLNFFAIGVQDADIDVLKQLAPNEAPPKMLDGLKFAEFFQWLSTSLASTSRSSSGQQVALPPTDSWSAIQA